MTIPSLKIGMIGLDTSHVVAFTRALHGTPRVLRDDLPQARVVSAFPGGSPDFHLSAGRVAGFTEQLHNEFGVAILDSIEAVAESSDLIFIESVDGRVHLDQFRRVVNFGKPVFIDKPFATSLEDAEQIVRLAQENDVALMSCSSLRYCEVLQLELSKGRDGILSCDAFGPMNEEPTQPGLFWYGIHMVEMVIAAMGPGVKSVRGSRNDAHDLIYATWADGRVATLHGLRQVHSRFGLTLHTKENAITIDTKIGKPYYHGLLEAILSSLPQRQWLIPAEEMLDVIRFITLANHARDEC